MAGRHGLIGQECGDIEVRRRMTSWCSHARNRLTDFQRNARRSVAVLVLLLEISREHVAFAIQDERSRIRDHGAVYRGASAPRAWLSFRAAVRGRSRCRFSQSVAHRDTRARRWGQRLLDTFAPCSARLRRASSASTCQGSQDGARHLRPHSSPGIRRRWNSKRPAQPRAAGS